MDFRLELNIKAWSTQIGIQDKIMLLGSCFTEHMSRKLQLHGFSIMENPHGILFNPASILNALSDYEKASAYNHTQLFEQNGIWQSWNHHGLFGDCNPQKALDAINKNIKEAGNFLPSAQWLIITLGSAFVYELKAGTIYNQHPGEPVVANCHKVPADAFRHRMLNIAETEELLSGIVDLARRMNNGINIIFTISPVRHAREGLVENNRSKGVLHNAVYTITGQYENVFYFPSYELVIDDLRDYRFYAEDMVHPNYQATQYVWDKFMAAAIDTKSWAVMNEVYKINAAIRHKPLYPESREHKLFMQKMLAQATTLALREPYLKLDEEIAWFAERAD